MDLMAGLSAASQALNIVKQLNEIDKSLDQATFKLKVAELASAVAETKLAMAEIQSEMREKDNEIGRLREAFRFRQEDTVEVRGYRYRKGANGKPQGMPYCPRCEAVNGLLIPTAFVLTSTTCPNCKAHFGREHGFTWDNPQPS